jgi:hypothetical protein
MIQYLNMAAMVCLRRRTLHYVLYYPKPDPKEDEKGEKVSYKAKT